MQLFTYEYDGIVYDAFAEHYTVEMYNRYRIIHENRTVVIAPTGTPIPGMIIWIQVNKPEEIIYAHGLIQAMGEGLERARIY
jgi:hypothetical protein